MLHPAVFLDRDGTLIEQVYHLVELSKVQLIPNAADAVTSLELTAVQSGAGGSVSIAKDNPFSHSAKIPISTR